MGKASVRNIKTENDRLKIIEKHEMIFRDMTYGTSIPFSNYRLPQIDGYLLIGCWLNGIEAKLSCRINGEFLISMLRISGVPTGIPSGTFAFDKTPGGNYPNSFKLSLDLIYQKLPAYNDFPSGTGATGHYLLDGTYTGTGINY